MTPYISTKISNNQTGIILSIYFKHIFVISKKRMSQRDLPQLFLLTRSFLFPAPRPPLGLSGSLWLDLLLSLALTGSLSHSLALYGPIWLSLWLPLALIASVARHATSLLSKTALGSPFTKKRLVSKYSAWLKSGTSRSLSLTSPYLLLAAWVFALNT